MRGPVYNINNDALSSDLLHSLNELSVTARVHMARHSDTHTDPTRQMNGMQDPDNEQLKTQAQASSLAHQALFVSCTSRVGILDTFTSRRRQHVVWNPRITNPGCCLVPPDEWDRVMCPSVGAPDEGLTPA